MGYGLIQYAAANRPWSSGSSTARFAYSSAQWQARTRGTPFEPCLYPSTIAEDREARQDDRGRDLIGLEQFDHEDDGVVRAYPRRRDAEAVREPGWDRQFA